MISTIDISYICVGFSVHLIISWTASVAFSFFRVFTPT